MAKKQRKDESGMTRGAKAKEAVRIATQLIDTWDKFARNRLNQIQEKEENYMGKVRPRTSGRSNFPVPVLAKYVDEIKSRLDESPELKFDSDVSPSVSMAGKKVTAVIRKLKKPSAGNWNKYDRNSRNLAIFAGYNAVELYSEENDGKFKLCFKPIDHNEFIFEAGGGNDLEQHSGVGVFPIWRTKGEMESRVQSGTYDKRQVEKLFERYQGNDFKKHDEFFKNKNERYKALGIDIENNDYVGQQVVALAQIQMTIDFGEGPERFLITFDYQSGIWVRFQPLIEVFPSGMYSIDLWQTHEDQNTVMCKAPVDDLWPFAEGIRVKVNQLFDNHTQKIYGQIGYDPNFVPDPSQLPWRHEGQMTKMKAYGGRPISQGIHKFVTDDMTNSTLEFVKWMDGFLTSVAGINPNDVSEDVAKVGILFGQIQKTSARMGIYNKSFKEMWERLGHRALHELSFMTEKMSIKIQGTSGADWQDFVGKELEDPDDFDVIAEGSNVELEMNESRQKHQIAVIGQILEDQDMKKEINLKAAVKMLIKSAQFSENDRRQLLDVKNYGNEEMIARADEACEEILKGKEPDIYPGADISFGQYILEFANKLDLDDADIKVKLIEYAQAHRSYIIKNMASKGMDELANKGVTPDKLGDMQHPPETGMGGQTGAPAPAAPNAGGPSPEMLAKVKARGPRNLGHAPIPTPASSQRQPTPLPAK